MSYILILLLFLLPIFYESSHVFRYHFKIISYYVLLTLHSIYLIPMFIIRGRDVRNLVFGGKRVRWITHLLGIKWTLKNGELWAEDSSCIVICNHQNSLDVLGLFQFWHIPDKMTVVAKKMLMYVGPFGLAAWLCKLLFIDRSHSDRARQQMNDQMGELVKDGIKLCIFPEGTRRNTNQIHSFKKGAFYLAIHHQIPIQPVVFSSYQHFLNDETKNFDNGEIIATVLPRIPTKGLTEADIPALIEKSKRLMEEVYVESTLEAKANYSKTPIGLTDKLEQLKMRLEGKGNNNNNNNSASNNNNNNSSSSNKDEEDREDFVTKEGILNRQKPTLEKTIN